MSGLLHGAYGPAEAWPLRECGAAEARPLRECGALPVALVLAALLYASLAHAIGSIGATADKQQITVGEPLQYTVTLIAPPGAQVALPGAEAPFKLFEVRDYKPTQTALADGSTQFVLQYTLVCFDVGTQGIKDFTVPVTPAGGKAEKYLAPPLDIKVASVLPAKGQTQPKPSYGPLQLRAWWAEWVLPGLLALVVLAVVAVLVWWLRRRRQGVGAVEAAEEILPPDEAALRSLERLAGEELIARGEFLVFYQRLDETLRAWLQARFDIPALERTSLGISYFLRVRREADPWRGSLLELLRAGDRVKYAKLLPTDETAAAHLEQAREVIAAARPVAPEPEAAAAGASEELPTISAPPPPPRQGGGA